MDGSKTVIIDKDLIDLDDFKSVWLIELPELESLAAGNNPDSRLNRLNDKYQNLARELGDSTSDKSQATFADNENIKSLLGTLGIVTGTTGIIMGLLAGAAAFDISDELKLAAKIDSTNDMLILDGKSVDIVNWDLCTSIIGHINTWLNPLLATRIASLSEIISISNEADLAKQRLKLYISAIEELNGTLFQLKKLAEHYANGWEGRRQTYQSYEANLLSQYQEEKHRLKLANDALLINTSEYTLKFRELEDKYKLETCRVDGVIGTCSHLKAQNSAYCFFHSCYLPGCSERAVKDKHYCKTHTSLSNTELPYFDDDVKSESPDERKQFLLFISVIVVVLLFCFWVNLNKPLEDNQPTPKSSSLQAIADPEVEASPTTELTPIIDRVKALHGQKSDAEWTEEDMVAIVNVLADPQTAADKAYLEESDAFYTNPELDCTGAGCMLRQREFAAAKLIREGKATTAMAALGIN